MSHFGKQGIKDLAVGAEVHASHFGALKTSPTVPVLKENFPGSSLNTAIWDETTANGGSTTVEDGVGKLNTGTNAAGSVKLLTVEQGIFEAGQVTVYQSGVRAAAPIASCTQRWGLMDAAEQNGLFFEMLGTAFRVVARKGGSDTAVAQGSFSGDQSFTPSATNNTYRIFYSAGRAIFCRADAGNVVVLHVMTDGNLPLVDDLDLGLYYEITNTGSTTDSELRVRGASSSVFGQLPTTRANGVEQITDQTVMMLGKSVLVGRGLGGTYYNVGVNTGGGLLVAEFGTEVALGNIPGYASDTKFGRVRAQDAADNAVDIWSFADDTASPRSDTKTFPSAAATIYLASSSGSDTNVDIDVTYIDSTGALAEALAVNLNGQTPVSIGATGLDVLRIKVSAGSPNAPVGIIYASITNDFTAGAPNDVTDILAVAPAGFGQSQLSHFTVPLGKTLVMKEVYILIARVSGAAGSAEVTLRITEFGGHQRVVRQFFPTTSVPISRGVKNFVVPARAQIVWRVDDVSDSDTDVSCTWGYELIDD